MKNSRSLLPLTLLLVFLPTIAFAGLSYSAGPSKSRGMFEYQVYPGMKIVDTLSLANFTDEPIKIAIFARSARFDGPAVDIIDEKTYNPETWYFDVSAPYLMGHIDDNSGVPSWISLNKETVTLPPRGTTEVPFTLQIPEDTQVYRSFFGYIVTSEVEEEEKNYSESENTITGVGSSVKTQAGTRIFVHVLPDKYKNVLLGKNEKLTPKTGILKKAALPVLVVLLLTAFTYKTLLNKNKKNKKTKK